MRKTYADMTPEEIQVDRERRRAWRKKNRDKVNKQQSKRRAERVAEGWQPKRPPREYERRKSAERRERLRAVSRELMTPCVDCGAFDVRFMDWHHRDPATKVSSIGDLIAKSRANGAEEIKAEIAKCDCLCSNCHRIRHSSM